MERILEPIGPLIALDKASMARTRPTPAKARVEIDLSKPNLKEVEVELVDGNGELDIFNQLIEYEYISEFFFHCQIQGHSDAICRIQQPKGEEPGTTDKQKTKQTENIMDEDEGGWTEVKNSKNNRKQAKENSKNGDLNNGSTQKTNP